MFPTAGVSGISQPELSLCIPYLLGNDFPGGWYRHTGAYLWQFPLGGPPWSDTWLRVGLAMSCLIDSVRVWHLFTVGEGLCWSQGEAAVFT